MIKCIAVNLGYIESSQIANLIFTNPQGFSDAKTAIKNLANGLFAKYTTDVVDFPSTPKNKCCQKSLKKDITNKFCSKCGASLICEFDILGYVDWIRNFGKLTSDDFGGTEIEDGRGGTWNPWNSFSSLLETITLSELAEIQESGEVVLIKAINKDLFPRDKEMEEEIDTLGYVDKEMRDWS